MKKRTLLFVMILMAFSFALSGCSHKHKLKPATCEEASKCKWCKYTEGQPLGHDIVGATCTEEGTCARCGKTTGGPLGHNFMPATCQVPSTCDRCGLTEGEKVDHEYMPANLQFGEKCTMCGDQRTEKLPGDFEKNGMECKAVLNVAYDYPTCTIEYAEKETTPTVTYTSFEVCKNTPKTVELVELPKASEGYVWVKAVAAINSTDVNGATYGVTYSYVCEDYYDILKHDGTLLSNSDGVYTYTVNYDGKDYEDCKCFVESKDQWTVGEGGITEVYFYFCVPQNYDGCVIGFIDARTMWDETDHINTIYDAENTMLYRLPKAGDGE